MKEEILEMIEKWTIIIENLGDDKKKNRQQIWKKTWKWSDKISKNDRKIKDNGGENVKMKKKIWEIIERIKKMM